MSNKYKTTTQLAGEGFSTWANTPPEFYTKLKEKLNQPKPLTPEEQAKVDAEKARKDMEIQQAGDANRAAQEKALQMILQKQAKPVQPSVDPVQEELDYLDSAIEFEEDPMKKQQMMMRRKRIKDSGRL